MVQFYFKFLKIKLQQCLFLLLLLLGYNCQTTKVYHIPNSNQFINKASDYIRQAPEHLSYVLEDLNIEIYAEKFSQGKLVYIELLASEEMLKVITNVQLKYQEQNIRLTFMGWGYRGFIGINPHEATGSKAIYCSYNKVVDENNTKVLKNIHNIFLFTVHKEPFSSSLKSFEIEPPSISKVIDAELIKKQRLFRELSTVKKSEAFKKMYEDMIDRSIAHPRDAHHITASFHEKRVSTGYRLVRGRRINAHSSFYHHTGTDLRGRIGTPIYAIAKGVVVLAEPLYLEGNFTLINHGNDIFSGYLHQSKILTKAGSKVKAGEKIGLVGATGRVTGPHLHIFLRVKGVFIDPLSILSLPIRD